MSYWFWCASCPCGYQSAWHHQEWFARLLTYLHALLSGHRRGDMTVAACDVGKIEAQVTAMQEGRLTKRAADAPLWRCKTCGTENSFDNANCSACGKSGRR